MTPVMLASCSYVQLHINAEHVQDAGLQSSYCSSRPHPEVGMILEIKAPADATCS